MNIAVLINEAERLLTKHPYDEGHDLSHHQRVLGNALEIVDSEEVGVDKDILQVACMWHDVVLEPKDEKEARQIHIDETLEYLHELMNKHGFNYEFISKVVRAIKDHGFEKRKQANLEGEVLFDADKLDALNPIRYKNLIKAIKAKKFSRFKILMYKQAAKLWLRTMRGRYHFESSKLMHDEMIVNLLKDKEALELGHQLGIDIVGLVKK